MKGYPKIERRIKPVYRQDHTVIAVPIKKSSGSKYYLVQITLGEKVKTLHRQFERAAPALEYGRIVMKRYEALKKGEQNAELLSSDSNA